MPTADGETYVLYFSTGQPPASFHFWLEAESDAPIELVVVGHYLEQVTSEMRELMTALPTWVDPTHSVSTWTSRIV